RITPSVAEQEGQQTETEATGAPQKHHYTLNQQVGSITKVAYKLDNNWSPYGEIGNVGVNDRSDRQTRFRVGVAYSF
ncbi:oligogalacturonate-specific porin KdgM family protein, partial [Klebsiella pneumoniae]|uniref:oligogalacturonate-specific porin KdgM family protein n=1 Tax=Klebsiella pneumoniae TaxID=573 RepID=UPI003EF410C1